MDIAHAWTEAYPPARAGLVRTASRLVAADHASARQLRATCLRGDVDTALRISRPAAWALQHGALVLAPSWWSAADTADAVLIDAEDTLFLLSHVSDEFFRLKTLLSGLPGFESAIARRPSPSLRTGFKNDPIYRYAADLCDGPLQGPHSAPRRSGIAAQLASVVAEALGYEPLIG
eukprot:m.233974 g.233974  ORF g.233974 m.233974 type:complete len:176 (-) comp12596_c0_seq1:339-866(-)